MTRPRPPHEDDRQEPCGPHAGEAGPAEEIDPLGVAGPDAPEPPAARPRAMPAPGTPASADEFARLKERAEADRQDEDGPAQEDG